MKNGIIITAYENISHTKTNIDLLREMSIYKDAQIIVITTSSNKNIQKGFQNLSNNKTKLITLNAPGNPGVNWEPPDGNYDGLTEQNIWRAKYLPARLLYSMSAGFNEMSKLDVEYCLHLHSDTFWKIEAERLLIEEQERLKEVYGFWDTCLEDNGIYAPFGIHIHPAPIHINLQRCKELDIINLYKVFFHPIFRHYNFISIESLIGCWTNFCLSNNSILSADDKCSPIYYDRFKSRCKRDYHGTFDHIINLPGTQ